MTIGITGAGGLLGFHLRALLLKEGEQFAIAERNAFKDEAALDDFVRKSDVIVHLAAETRGDDSKVYEENIKITEELLSSLRRTNSRKPVIFSSTVQIEQETGYGRSKRETGEALLAWGKETGSPVTVVVIQNVFGEYARPFHNSVVATFCTQLIKNEPSQVNGSASIQIMHAQAVAETLIHYVRSPQHGVIRMERWPRSAPN
jgi:UDP-2-acetamido-2,6-beta-L-arabino-hexul-4-ose reductase